MLKTLRIIVAESNAIIFFSLLDFMGETSFSYYLLDDISDITISIL